MEEGTPYLDIMIDGEVFSGVSLKMNIENTLLGMVVFTAVGSDTQVTLWGSRVPEETYFAHGCAFSGVAAK